MTMLQQQQYRGHFKLAIRLLLLLFTALSVSGCHVGKREYIYAESAIRILYGVDEPEDRQRALAVFAEHAPEDLVCQAYQQAEARRLAKSRKEAEHWRKQLQKTELLLVEKLIRQPTAIEAFALAELLSCNYAFYYDRQLAEVLYNYSADHGWRRVVDAAGNHRRSVLAQGAEQMAQALQQINWQAKLSGLYQVLQSGYTPAALALAVVYSSKPHRQLGMAINAVILSLEYPERSAEAEQVLLELNKLIGCALALLIMNENVLKTPGDLAGLHLNMDFALTLLLSGSTAPQGYKIIGETAAENEGFLHSGAIFDLTLYNYPASELKKLLQCGSGADSLNAHLTGALLAGELNDGAWQLSEAEHIFTYLAGQKVPELPVDLRRKLIAVIPGVAKLKLWEKPQRLNKQLLTSRILWNIAVYTKVNALLQLNRPEEAQRFLSKYSRHRLPGILPELERDLIRRFAPGVLRNYKEK